ncbi:MAG: helix-turn-helix transcriptional regulator [Pseudomonadota bacterium]
MDQNSQTLEDVARYGPHQHHVVDMKSTGALPTHFVEIDVAAGSNRFTPHSEFMLGQILRMTDVGRIDNEHGRRPYTRSDPGDLELVTPWSNGIYSCDGQTNLILMSISPRHIDDVLEGQRSSYRGDFGHLHSGKFKSIAIRNLFDQLWWCCGQNKPFSNLAAEGLRTAIIAQLLNLSQHQIHLTSGSRHRIPSGVMRQIDDFVDTVQDAKVYTRDLANIAGVPVSTFSRVFRETTGQTAYQYVLERRIARARQMLESREDPLAQIAYDVGFSSQAHMTDVFKKRIGITPGEYRKQRRD